MMVAHKRASMIGFRVPAANGATVKGISAADISLDTVSDGLLLLKNYVVPLKSPMIAAMYC